VKTTSPLTAIAIATQEASSPNPLAGGRERDGKPKERLVDAVKAVTPTVVVVGSDREEEWDATTRRLKVGDKVMGLAERRRLLALNGKNAGGTGGLDVTGREAQMQNRKSERVVVERIST
jgi:hypothetical protein